MLLKIAREDVVIYSLQLLQGQEKICRCSVVRVSIKKAHISRDIYVNTQSVIDTFKFRAQILVIEKLYNRKTTS